MSLDPTLTPQTAQPKPKNGRKRAAIITAAAVALVAAIGIPVGIGVANNIHQQERTNQALADFKAANDACELAAATVAETTTFLDEQKAAFDGHYNAIYTTVQPNPALFSAETVEALGATVTAYNELLTGLNITPDDAVAPEGEQVKVIWDVTEPEDFDLEEDELIAQYLDDSTYADAAKAVQQATEDCGDIAAQNLDVQDSFTDVTEQTNADIVALAAAATVEVKDAYITASAPKSAPESQTAVTTALAEVAKIADGSFEAQPDAEPAVTELTVIKAYVDAAAGAKQSHDAVVAAEAEAARIAAEEAARQAERQSSGGGSGGSRGGSGGGGGSTGGSGGGSGDGSTGGGGGGSAPQPITGYPAYTQPAASAGSSGSNCGAGAIPIPSNATVTGQGYDAGASCYRVSWKVPGVDW